MKQKAELLHIEAFASLIIIEDRYFNCANLQEFNRVARILTKARNRVYRRWENVYGK